MPSAEGLRGHRSIDRRTVEHQLDRPLGEFYLDRVRLHMDDSYVGVRMRKFPEDLRAFEHLLWECRIDAVVEVGLGHGGSALWFRDRLRALSGYRGGGDGLVVSVDVDVAEGRENLQQVDPDFAATIRLVEADVRSPDVVNMVRRHLSRQSRVLVVDDSAHRYDTTLATLRGFSPLVPVGGYLVVEDGHRDLPGMLPAEVPGKARGVQDAIAHWLANEAGGSFERRRDQERYVVTSNPGGFLQRVA